MTYEAIMLAIGRLGLKRAEAHGNPQEQARITAKMEKLRALKDIMLEQMAKES